MEATRGKLFIDVDGMGAGNSAYHRISTRKAPHNAYTSSADLWRVAATLGGGGTIDPDVHVRPFRDDGPAADRPGSQTVSLPDPPAQVRCAYGAQANRV